MDPVTGSLLGSVGSSLLGGLFGKKSTDDANEAQIASAREQMEFQRQANQKAMDFSERMSSTAHQRQVADMRAAGLNPILSAKYGGASSPSGVTSGGAQANIQSAGPIISQAFANVGKAFQAIPQAVQQVASAKQLETQSKLTTEQVEKTKAETKSVLQNLRNLNALENKTDAETQRIYTDIQHVIAKIDETIAREKQISISNVTAGARAQFLKENPWILKTGTALREIPIDQLITGFQKTFREMLNPKPKGSRTHTTTTKSGGVTTTRSSTRSEY